MLTLTTFTMTREIGPERSLVLVTSPDQGSSEVRRTKASGRTLKVCGAMSAYLRAEGEAAGLIRKKVANRDEITLNIVVDPEVHDEVVTATDTGVLESTSSVHVLGALSKKVAKQRSLGMTISFTAGEGELNAHQQQHWDAAIKSDQREMARDERKAGQWALPTEDARWVEETGATVIYTDGSCDTLSGVSSWAWYIDEDNFDSGVVAPSTSTCVERLAAVEALKANPGPVLLVTDLDSLLPGNSMRVLSVQEERVVKSLRSLVRSRQVRILKVKGHLHCPGNLAVDAKAGETLAKACAKISETPGLYEKMQSLRDLRKLELKQRRAEAQARREAHLKLHGEKYLAERKRRKALKRAALAA